VIGQDGPIPRLVVLDKLKQVQKNSWFQDWEYDRWVNEYYHLSIIKGMHHRVDVLFSGVQFIIVEVKIGMARRSKIYDNFQRARRAWDRERVAWVEQLKFNYLVLRAPSQLGLPAARRDSPPRRAAPILFACYVSIPGPR